MVIITMLSDIYAEIYYADCYWVIFSNAECLYDDYCSCSVFMPCVVMLNVILIDFTMLSINVNYDQDFKMLSAECLMQFSIMLRVIGQTVVILSVVMPSTDNVESH